MSNKLFMLSILALLLITSACEKSAIEYDDAGTKPKDTTPVSFANDIQPIFTTHCTGCHNSGFSPNLTSGSAYNSLNNPKYIDTANPDNSLIYTKLATTGSSHEGRATTTETSKLLKWIQQGALDN